MGAGKKQALRVTFDSRLKLECHNSKVTSDAGLLAYRELDAALGLTLLGEDLLSDWRTAKNTQHSMVALTTATTKEVFSYPGETGQWLPKWRPNTSCVIKKPRADCKNDLQTCGAGIKSGKWSTLVVGKKRHGKCH